VTWRLVTAAAPVRAASRLHAHQMPINSQSLLSSGTPRSELHFALAPRHLLWERGKQGKTACCLHDATG
jgi:hypothetical protein